LLESPDTTFREDNDYNCCGRRVSIRIQNYVGAEFLSDGGEERTL